MMTWTDLRNFKIFEIFEIFENLDRKFQNFANFENFRIFEISLTSDWSALSDAGTAWWLVRRRQVIRAARAPPEPSDME